MIFFKKTQILGFLSLIFSCKQESSQKVETNDWEKEKIEVYSLTEAQNDSKSYLLSFKSLNDGTKKLEMIIGESEAQALAVTIEKLKPSAPLPLDLFQDALIKLNCDVKEVVIYNLNKGIYKAKIVCNNATQVIELTARPADAVTIALKFGCPIFASRKLLEN